MLRDRDQTIAESSIIVEYLALHYPGSTQLIPSIGDAALQTRFLDRFFDIYVMNPMQSLVADRMRNANERDMKGVQDAKTTLDLAYAWLEDHLAPQGWACASDFSLADCSAAPALFYADWVHRIGDKFGNILAYRQHLLTRPSVVRVVEEARPYRELFPGGAPERD